MKVVRVKFRRRIELGYIDGHWKNTYYCKSKATALLLKKLWIKYSKKGTLKPKVKIVKLKKRHIVNKHTLFKVLLFRNGKLYKVLRLTTEVVAAFALAEAWAYYSHNNKSILFEDYLHVRKKTIFTKT